MGQSNKRKQKARLLSLTVGAWNVRTLLDNDSRNRPERRTALIGRELARYNVDIAALSETRLADEAISVKMEQATHSTGAVEKKKRGVRLALALRSEQP